MTPSAPTLEMVAAAAGVSRATVSRVVNGSPKVSPQVVDAVNKAIVDLNYVPNRAARTLASRQAMAIALLIPEDIGRFYSDPYFASVVKGITERLEPTDYVLNLLVSSSDPRHKTRRYLGGGTVDGALVVSHHAGNRDLIELSDIVPTVFGGDPTTMLGLHERYYVDVDNLGGAREATRHLIRLGRHRIGTVTGAMDMHAAVHRLTGWRQAMAEAGLDDTAVAHGDFTSYGGAAAMRELLARPAGARCRFRGQRPDGAGCADHARRRRQTGARRRGRGRLRRQFRSDQRAAEAYHRPPGGGPDGLGDGGHAAGAAGRPDS